MKKDLKYLDKFAQLIWDFGLENSIPPDELVLYLLSSVCGMSEGLNVSTKDFKKLLKEHTLIYNEMLKIRKKENTIS